MVFVSLWMEYYMCQCPHRLVPHCYIQRAYGKTKLTMILCQCPHGLVPHCYTIMKSTSCQSGDCVNALTGLCLISTASVKRTISAYIEVSMPSRAYASFLLSRMFEIIKVRDKFGVNALTGLCLISTYMYSMSI